MKSLEEIVESIKTDIAEPEPVRFEALESAKTYWTYGILATEK